MDLAERTLPGQLPRALPLGHTGRSEHFADILSANLLTPRYCSVMRKRTLYFFYGSLSYRLSDEPTLEDTAYPVGFLFHPRVLEDPDVHYPFDTGAMAKGLYGNLPSGFRSYKKSFRIELAGLSAAENAIDCPRMMVKHLFGSNRRYLAGRPMTGAIGKPNPIPALLRFILSESDRSDHRRACVETQKHVSVPLSDHLLWIGYPEIFNGNVQQYLRENDPPMFRETWPYPTFARYRPSEVCAQMQGRASAVLDKSFSD